MDLGPRLHYLLMRSLAAFSTSALWVGPCWAVSPTALATLRASSPAHGCSQLDLNPVPCLASPGQVPAGEDPSGDIPLSVPTVFAASCFRCLVDVVPVKNEDGAVIMFILNFEDLAQLLAKRGSRSLSQRLLRQSFLGSGEEEGRWSGRGGAGHGRGRGMWRLGGGSIGCRIRSQP